MQDAQISEQELKDWLKNGEFEVHFSESDTRAEPKVYVLKRQVGNQLLTLNVALIDTIALIDKLYFDNDAESSCTQAQGEYLLWMPEKQIKNGVSKRKVTATQHVLEQTEGLGINLEECKRVLLEGKVNEELSEVLTDKDPVWVMEDMTNVGKLQVKFVLGSELVLIIDVTTHNE
jgi:hypothetical protein